jgi:hypothetical protein
VSCGGGLSNCGGVCRDLSTDRANCGGCGVACAAGQVCSGGSCQVSCGAGLSNCGGVCRDLSSDRANCGGCGRDCSPGQICVGGACRYSCPSGQYECSGTCVDGTSATCSGATNLGTIIDGAATYSTIEQLPGPGQVDWYTVRFPSRYDFAQHGTGTPSVSLTRNDGGAFRIQLYHTCSARFPGCGGSYTSWSIRDNRSGTAYRDRSTDWPNQLWIRVSRVGGSACASYQLAISR